MAGDLIKMVDEKTNDFEFTGVIRKTFSECGSYYITIPKKYCELYDLSKGDFVNVIITKLGKKEVKKNVSR